MARDGTQRGGVRIGAGKKRKPLEEKILEGRTDEQDTTPSTKAAKTDIKPPKKYLTADQKTGGGKTCARQIYRETWEWIAAHGCEDFVTKQLVESFAHVTARHIQCEELLSFAGLIGKHPTTKEPTASIFVKMSIDYLKQASQLWYQIYAAVRDNSTKSIGGTEQSEVMEVLLKRVK